VRRELGVRTIFNILGPLTNPAGAPNILMGVFHPDLVGIQVRVLQRLGAEHAVVVYGKDGMDEISLGAATMVGELKDGGSASTRSIPRTSACHGQPRVLKVETVAQSKALLLAVLSNEPGPARDIVILNAGVALYAANVAATMATAWRWRANALASGAALARLLDDFVAAPTSSAWPRHEQHPRRSSPSSARKWRPPAPAWLPRCGSRPRQNKPHRADFAGALRAKVAPASRR
jgi:anthranilate phosphoribosyltransferase